jgi:hypothetical protein
LNVAAWMPSAKWTSYGRTTRLNQPGWATGILTVVSGNLRKLAVASMYNMRECYAIMDDKAVYANGDSNSIAPQGL